MAKTIMIQGTASSVGKSVLTAALCRIFLQDGFRVCPFKAQNMSLNSFVTKDGLEISRAQGTQAQASCIEPVSDMNPVLLKPNSDGAAQVIVDGKPVGNMSVYEYRRYKPKALKSVAASFGRLNQKYDIVVIEGAGSPAEINLKRHDIVNMKMAEMAAAPVLLAADIDRGGVFASLVGTLELLEKKERRRIKGFIINKFRGDRRLLAGGLDFLRRKTGKPVLGVIPYFSRGGPGAILLPDEDSQNLDERKSEKNSKIKKLCIAVVKFPRLANFTDFDCFHRESDVRLIYAQQPQELKGADIIILPGTKNTIADLKWLKESGFKEIILSIMDHRLSAVLVGICGGFQMLGEFIYDRTGVESAGQKMKGLGLLPMATSFEKEKILARREAVDLKTKIRIKGYEIHHGRTVSGRGLRPVFSICAEDRFDGARSKDGRVWGSYLHGLFDNPDLRRDFLNRARARKGLAALPEREVRFNLQDEFDKLADLVRENLDMKLLYRILNHAL